MGVGGGLKVGGEGGGLKVGFELPPIPPQFHWGGGAVIPRGPPLPSKTAKDSLGGFHGWLGWGVGGVWMDRGVGGKHNPYHPCYILLFIFLFYNQKKIYKTLYVFLTKI